MRFAILWLIQILKRCDSSKLLKSHSVKWLNKVSSHCCSALITRIQIKFQGLLVLRNLLIWLRNGVVSTSKLPSDVSPARLHLILFQMTKGFGTLTLFHRTRILLLTNRCIILACNNSNSNRGKSSNQTYEGTRLLGKFSSELGFTCTPRSPQILRNQQILPGYFRIYRGEMQLRIFGRSPHFRL